MDCKGCGKTLGADEGRKVGNWAFCPSCFENLLKAPAAPAPKPAASPKSPPSPPPPPAPQPLQCHLCGAKIHGDRHKKLGDWAICDNCYIELSPVTLPTPVVAEKEDPTATRPEVQPVTIFPGSSSGKQCETCGRELIEGGYYTVDQATYCPNCYYELPQHAKPKDREPANIKLTDKTGAATDTAFASRETMQIQRTTFAGNDNCYELTLGHRKMVVAVGFGPRILHLSIGNGANILFVDQGRKLRRNGWILYGGHRLWISPETDATYHPDNSPCQVTHEDDHLTVSQYDPLSGLEKSITIAAQNGRFLVAHTVINRKDFLYPGALWALTCVKPQGTVFFPWGSIGDWDIKKIQYWQKWPGQSSMIGSSQYVQGQDLFLIKPTGEMGKVGTGGYEGFIGVTGPHYTFIKKFDRDLAGQYPDDNCAIECYTCKEFVELETLSPLYTLHPNVPYTHKEEWLLLDYEIDPEDGAAVRKLLPNCRVRSKGLDKDVPFS